MDKADVIRWLSAKKAVRQGTKVGIPLIIGLGLLWYVYRDVDVTRMWEDILKGVRYEIIAGSLLFGLMANIIRGVRWCLLLDQLETPFRKCNAIHAVLGNYTVNLVLPRVGEIWRCGVVARYDKIPFTKLFGTLLIDRVSDVVAVGVIAFFVLLFNVPFLREFLTAHPSLFNGQGGLFRSVWLYVVLAVGIIGIWFILRYMQDFSFVRKLRELLGNVWIGMRSVWTMKRKRLFLVHTVLIWGLYFLYFYVTFFAFDFTKDLGIGTGILAFVMGSIAVAVPVQAGIGAWHFAIMATLCYLGVAESDAGAFALVVHTIQTVWTGLCGLVSIALLPLLNRERKEKL
ncbi:MAG: flippase-like domain-containing protein [Tannerellaceae bacterium]|jgi:hypothetical protein|nr:flippase-like domain-containing protein [Tannerellaceae bacterium]